MSENSWKSSLYHEVAMLYPDFNELAALKDRKTIPQTESRRPVKSAFTGEGSSPFRGQGLEFDSVREYVPGDDIRNIDWRVTARTGAPHLKLFREDRERQLMICVDVNAGMRFGTRNTFKSVQAARAAALLGWQGINRHDAVSACLFGDVPRGVRLFPPKRTRQPFCAALKMLSLPPAERCAVPLSQALLQAERLLPSSGALLYIISDFLDFGSDSLLDPVLTRIKKKCDIVLISINDPADKELFPMGLIRFCDPPGGKRVCINTDSAAGRKAYADQWSDNRRKLFDAASRLKISLLEITTESNVPRELFLGLNSLAKRRGR